MKVRKTHCCCTPTDWLVLVHRNVTAKLMCSLSDQSLDDMQYDGLVEESVAISVASETPVDVDTKM